MNAITVSSNVSAVPSGSTLLTQISPDIPWSTNGTPQGFHHLLGLSEKHTFGMLFRKNPQYARVLHNFHRTHNLYIGINPTSNFRVARPAAEHITHVTGILVDIDPPEGAIAPSSFDTAIGILMWFRDAYGIPDDISHLMIHSGRGIQILYPVGASPLLTPSLRDGWKASVSSFLHTLAQRPVPGVGRVDVACSDLARVRRAVGSINQKTGRIATVMSGLDSDKSFIFNDFLAKWSPEKKVESIQPAANQKDWWRQFRLFPVSARRFLTEEVEHGQRNHDAFCAAASLFDAGANTTTVRAVLLKANSRQPAPLDNHELSRIINNALKKGTRNAAF